MKRLFLMLLLAGCASYGGMGLEPGKATAADVRAKMGEPTTVRKLADGGEVLWYSRLPYGRESFAVRLDKDGRLASIEQRLTSDHIAKVVPNKSSAEDVLDTLGPPYRVLDLPRQERKAWEYQLKGNFTPQVLYVQLSADNVVRELVQIEDQAPRPGIFFGFGGIGVGF